MRLSDWYRPGGGPPGGRALDLPEPLSARASDPSRYRPSPDLVDAVNVALALGQPLLLTGEPGCGKTQLAPHVAWALGLGFEKFETKSDSASGSLFYEYDALRHYRDATLGDRDGDPREYVQLAALGTAVLRTRPRDQRHGLDPGGPEEAVRTVVLIDEIDKAPRDFPNDLLNEIEHLYFRVPEIGVTVEADPALRPVVVITSNEERALPAPFLRRCVFHYVKFPSRDEVEEIVLGQLGDGGGPDAFTGDVLDAFLAIRAPAVGLARRPGLSELLGWISVLRTEDGAAGLDVELAKRTVGVIVKEEGDLERAARALDAWERARRAEP